MLWQKKGEPRWTSDKLRMIGLGSCSRILNSWTWWNIVIVQFRRPIGGFMCSTVVKFPWWSSSGNPTWESHRSRGFPPTNWPIVPSGKRLHNYGKIHLFQWVNPRTKWPFSIAMLVITRGYHFTSSSRTFLIWTMEVFMSDPRFQVSPVIWKTWLAVNFPIDF